MRFLCLLLFWALPLAAQPDTKPLAVKLAASNEGFWKSTQEPKGNVTSRGLFAYAFVLCEANQNLERLEGLFDLAVKMQDRDPNSKSYGNFKWKWDDEKIVDYNAVDFSMRGGSLLWIKHKDKIPAPAREKLRELLEFSVEGCLRHRVREDYTNIAFMNAGDLILLGETLDKPKVAAEGYKRLERALLYTHEFGTHEYVSPTYYGPDLDALVMIEAFAKRPRGVEQSRALLNYFWTDIALNWFAPAQKLSGTHSRSYDYLSGLGEFDKHAQLNGWLEGEPTGIDTIYTAQARWKPSDELKKMNAQYPRLVQQKWGVESNQWRTNYIQKDVALSTSGASYGGKMDFPLTVDFSDPRNSVRCYFTSDGRGDPYGKIRIAESATHSKALHLNPFWTASQNKEYASGLVRYKDVDIPPDTETLQSHFVMPLDNDGIWIGSSKVTFDKGNEVNESMVISPYEPVFMRKGSAGLVVMVSWARDVKGGAAPIYLTYDGNKFGAIRLTVTHYGNPHGAIRLPGTPDHDEKIGEVKQGKIPCGAGFFVVVTSQLTDEKWTAFRLKFLEQYGWAVRDRVNEHANSEVGLRKVVWSAMEIKPILSLNGKEIGRKLLEAAEPLKSGTRIGAVPELKIAATGGHYFEAEAGQIMPGFEIGDDAAASGGKFVWMPGDVGQGGGGGTASATWKLQTEAAGEFRLWGLVKAATPDDDSFFVRTLLKGNEVLPLTTWSIGTHEKWEWVRLPEKIILPKGETQLQLRVREDGAKIDRLYLARIPDEAPK